MHHLACCLLLIAAMPREDAPASPASAVAGRLAVAQARAEEALAARAWEYDRVAAGAGTAAEQQARYAAAAERCRAAIAPVVDDLLDAVAARPADPGCVAALRFVAVAGRALPDRVGRALALLRRDHVADPDVSLATGAMFLHHDRPEAIDFLRAVVATNPSRVERGRACLDLADLLAARVGATERARPRSPGGPDADVGLPALRAEAPACSTAARPSSPTSRSAPIPRPPPGAAS